MTFFKRFAAAFTGFLLFLCANTLPLLGVIFQTSHPKATTPDDLLIYLVFGTVLAGLSVWGLVRLYRKYSPDLQNKRLMPLKYILLAYVSIYLWSAASALISAKLDPSMTNLNDAAIGDLFNRPHWTNQAAVILMTVVFAPMAEELFFRGLLSHTLLKRIAKPWTVLIASLAFASLHVSGNWVFFLTYAGLGAILHTVYFKTGNIKNSIAVHMLNNGVAVLLQFML